MLMIRFYRNHVVVCGLGERGLRLAKDFSQHGYRVVVIEGVKDNNLVELCRRLNILWQSALMMEPMLR